MAIEIWISQFDEIISEEDLYNTQALQLTQFVQRYSEGVASVVEVRRNDDGELLILDVNTGAPQRPFHPINRIERIAILFSDIDEQPIVFVLRDDFPDTDHQQLVPEGFPAAICLDERPWAEARLTWSPAELIDRVVSWFHLTARGDLHDARQPIDPIFLGSPLKFLIARSIFRADAVGDLITEFDDENRRIMRVKRLEDTGDNVKNGEPLCIITYRVAPERMKRMRYAPNSLGSLSSMLSERDIDLFADLKKRLDDWIAEGDGAAWRLNARFAIIVEMPVVFSDGKLDHGTDLRAFVTGLSAGEIAVYLGIAMKVESVKEGSKIGYVKKIGNTDSNQNMMANVTVQNAEVHLEFDRDLATLLVGQNATEIRRVVLVGAGAMGSHLSNCLIREGRFLWTIIDDDILLPHNLARHTGTKGEVAQKKANIVARQLNNLLEEQDIVAEPLAANLFTKSANNKKINELLLEADIILDTTASVVASRALSDHCSTARRVSTFFNPSGESAVLLAEPASRNLTLRDLEAQYLGFVLRTKHLSRHLGGLAETVAYTGACRAITNRIPQSRVNVLTGLAASGLTRALENDKGSISIWSVCTSGAVKCDKIEPEAVLTFQSHNWTITVDIGLIRLIQDLRENHLPNETGGLLFGLVDVPAKEINLIHASPAPPDSQELSDEFERGIQGVIELIDDIQHRSAGQVRYVGEWHSHPAHATARPSAIDIKQVDWLAALLGMDSMPALMLISAENEFNIIFANETAQAYDSKKYNRIKTS